MVAADAGMRLRGMAGAQAGHLPPGRHSQASEAHADPALLPAQLRDAPLRKRHRPVGRHEDRGPHRLPDHREHLHAPQGGDAAQGFGQYGEGVSKQGTLNNH